MLTIPDRHLDRWVTVEGSRTGRAGDIPVYSQPIGYDAAAQDVMLAYNAYPPDPNLLITEDIVRVDFLTVVEMRFTWFWNECSPGDDRDRRYFALSVTDESPMKDAFLGTFRDPDDLFGTSDPATRLRHFTITFDNFGGYDILATTCHAQRFHAPEATTSFEVFEAAMRLGGPLGP